jgi:hypothetical protein
MCWPSVTKVALCWGEGKAPVAAACIWREKTALLGPTAGPAQSVFVPPVPYDGKKKLSFQQKIKQASEPRLACLHVAEAGNPLWAPAPVPSPAQFLVGNSEDVAVLPGSCSEAGQRRGPDEGTSCSLQSAMNSAQPL